MSTKKQRRTRRRRLRVESLEPRQMLTGVPLTIITHGFNDAPAGAAAPFGADLPPWVMDMAVALETNRYAPALASTPGASCPTTVSGLSGSILDVDPTAGAGNVGAGACPHFILPKWDSTSNAEGNKLISDLTTIIRNRVQNTTVPLDIHFIGFDRGAAVHTEVVRALNATAAFPDGTTVFDRIGHLQVTTLDPPATDPLVNNSTQPAVQRFDIVDYVDNYFQRAGTGVQGSQVTALLNNPGANPDYNIDISAELARWDSQRTGTNANHSEVHDWYHWTIANNVTDGSTVTLNDTTMGLVGTNLTLRNRRVDLYANIGTGGGVTETDPVLGNGGDSIDGDTVADNWDSGNRVGYFYTPVGGGLGNVVLSNVGATNSLYSVNLADGTLSVWLGTLGGRTLVDIAYDASGRLFGIDDTGNICPITRQSGFAAFTEPTGRVTRCMSVGFQANAMEFRNDRAIQNREFQGTLYVAAQRTTGPDVFVMEPGLTATTTPPTPFNNIQIPNSLEPGDLDFGDAGQLFVSADNGRMLTFTDSTATPTNSNSGRVGADLNGLIHDADRSILAAFTPSNDRMYRVNETDLTTTDTFSIAPAGANFVAAGASTINHAKIPAVTSPARPGVANDMYDVQQNVTLTVAAATGVLSNDPGFNVASPDSIAIVTTNPTKGTLTPNNNGGFSYQPNSGVTGVDEFKYVRFNTTTGLFSTEATVTLDVKVGQTLAIAATSANKAEGNSGTTPFTFTVTRSGGTTGTATANYAVTGSGTNQANATDFGGTLPSGMVTFNPTETTQMITVNVSGDATVEMDEGFTVTLSGATGAAITTATATGTILDDDDTHLEIAADAAQKAEGNSGTTNFTFTVTRSGNVSGATNVDFAVTGSGTNQAATTDIVGGTFPTGTLMFTATETTKTITVPVQGDTTVEPDEEFTVTLSNPTNSANIRTATAKSIIQNDDIDLAIAATSADKVEGDSGNTAFTFTVTRTGDTSGTTTANYAVTGSGTNPANAGDFNGGALPTGMVTFNATETSKVITVNVSGDTVIEQDEGFTITLSGPTSPAIITTATAGGTIQNDDALTLAIAPKTGTSVDKAEGSSGTTPFTFTVTRTGDTSIGTTVDYTVTGSTTLPGTSLADAADFSPGTVGDANKKQLTFAPGDVSKDIQIDVIADTILEGHDEFTVTLSNAGAPATIATATSVGRIVNDDGITLDLAAANADRPEGNTGTTPFTFTVTRTGDTSAVTTVNYAVTGSGTNPANAADFGGTLPSGTVTFNAGDATQTITANVSGDTVIEPDEGFTVTLSGETFPIQVTNRMATGTIRNDDSITLAVAATSADKAEGNSGNTNFTFTVTRSGDTSGATSVNFAVTGTGGAPADAADFGGTLPSGTVNFTAGETTKTITAAVSGDTVAESDEGFTVTLSGATASATIITPTATGTIRNDDSTTLAVAAADANKAEGDSGNTGFMFTVTRTGDTSGTSSATYTVTGSGGNPANAADFGGTLPTGPVNFAAGETTKTITVNVSGDTVIEPNEDFTVTLSNAGSAIIATPSAAGTILNDDSATLAIAATDASKAEGNSGNTGFTFTVTRTGDTSGTTTVDFAVTGSGTNPANAVDFGGTLLGGTLTFGPGQATRIITVNVSGDRDVELEEGFTVTLSGASSPATISTATANGAIQNDDAAPAILVTPTAGLVTDEAGTKMPTFTVVLSTAPIGNVTVALTSSNPAEGTVSPATLTFTPGNALTPQTVTVTGVDDSLEDGNIGYSILTGAATSTDTAYNGINPTDVSVINEDNESPNTIRGFVYLDLNNNGVKDVGETGLAGVPVAISGPVTRSKMTGADGSYRFNMLPRGTYSVRQTMQPTAFEDGQDTLGTPGLGTVASDAFVGIALSGGLDISGYNFGERGLKASASAANPLGTRLASANPGTAFTGGMMMPMTASGSMMTADLQGAPASFELYTAEFMPVAMASNALGLSAEVTQGENYILYVAAGGAIDLPVQVAFSDAVQAEPGFDINGDGIISPLDVLLVIQGLRLKAGPQDQFNGRVMDVNDDGALTSMDALLLIGRLRRDLESRMKPAEGEPYSVDDFHPETKDTRADEVSTLPVETGHRHIVLFSALESPVDHSIIAQTKPTPEIPRKDVRPSFAESETSLGTDDLPKETETDLALEEIVNDLAVDIAQQWWE